MLLAALILVACTQEETTSWEQYNGEDAVEIEVGGEELLPAVETVLTSNTGAVEVGTATVDPGGGPIGTVHTVQVFVNEDYKDDIDRVSVRTSSGDRGDDEYDLDKDSTGQGYWLTELESVGEEGEVRTDTLTFFLWTEIASTDEGE